MACVCNRCNLDCKYPSQLQRHQQRKNQCKITNNNYKDEDENVIFSYNSLKMRLTFYNDEDFKLGASNPMIESEEIELSGIKAEIAMEAINELSPSYKAVFNLYVFEDYKHIEIAEILGISEGTSKSNFAKAKMNLQKILKEKFMNID